MLLTNNRGYNLRARLLLAASAVTLGLLGSCLSSAQALEAAVPGSGVAVQASGDATPGSEDPMSEDLEDDSQDLDDLISQPAPEGLVAEDPGPTSEPSDAGESEPGVLVPDPLAGAADDQAACRTRLAAAQAAGGDDPVACMSWSTDMSASELRAAVDAWPTPNWCDDGARGKWYVNRFKACGIFPGDLTITNPRTGAVTGRMHYLVRAYAYSVRDQKKWAYQVELMEVTSSGSARGSSANGAAKCAGKCKVIESTFPSQLISQSKEPVGQFFQETTIKTSPKGQKGEGQAKAVWRFTNPLWAGPTNELSLPTPPVRCDNAVPGTSKAGCVMPYIPELVYAKNGPYPELARHIEYAQDTKNLPGKHGTTRYLTRLTDKEKKKANNRKACPPSLERPPGKQCDEYPFQSTWQGAATGSGDFSRRMIDKDQNRLGGGTLKNFYLFNRILEKDRFLVWIK
ncbi:MULTISPECIES: NucA/NucB deoxyribonuclease domain-containing protein [Streptomyces]|uniref:NucA/NucB deoxyribonuclease domain-containing protein n=1 Tax=Streptomyces TaxID=1883 RepID=UPI0016737E6D|nr:NucA/NucB deoxyribonuclease domain-containing protein [Streptomyces massasporeus]